MKLDDLIWLDGAGPRRVPRGTNSWSRAQHGLLPPDCDAIVRRRATGRKAS